MSAEDTLEPTPEDWLSDADEEFVVDKEISHPDPEFRCITRQGERTPPHRT
jgi:hypothetical protein